MLDQMFTFDTDKPDALSLKFLSEGLGSSADHKFDYIKYRQALKGLKEKNIEEQIALQSTLTTAETMGVKAQDILQSANKFLDLINSESAKFEKALNTQFEIKVEKKKEESELKQNEINSNLSKIAELQNRNKELENELSQSEQVIETNKTYIQDKKNKFNTTVATVIEYVKKDISILNGKM